MLVLAKELSCPNLLLVEPRVRPSFCCWPASAWSSLSIRPREEAEVGRAAEEQPPLLSAASRWASELVLATCRRWTLLPQTGAAVSTLPSASTVMAHWPEAPT